MDRRAVGVNDNGVMRRATRPVATSARRETAPPAHVLWLLEGDHAPAGAERGRLIQTHISYVVLRGDWAYKLKKPVDFGFLDYRSLERRRFFCEEEVRLNSRLSPDVYVGVSTVTRETGGRFTLDGSGEVVDYVVVMRRLADESMFDAVLARGGGTATEARTLAEIIARFHVEADRSGAESGFGSPAMIGLTWAENVAQVEPYVGRVVDAEAWESIRRYEESYLRDQEAVLLGRVEAGFVRDCHGDLRSESVALTEEAFLVLDCVEFNARLRIIDVISDLAFLLMDLESRDRADLSDEVLARYLSITQDMRWGGLLDFYRCYRAVVRGKVNALQLGEAEVPRKQKREALAASRRYLRLAARYAARRRDGRLVVMMGTTGSGKSYLAGALSGRLGAQLITSDATRKRLSGRDPWARTAASGVGVGIYSEAMTERTYAALLAEAQAELGRGEPVILDATFGRARWREAAAELAADCGVSCDFLLCEAPAAVVAARIEGRGEEVGAVSEGTWEVYLSQREAFETVAAIDGTGLQRIDTGGSLRESVAAALVGLGVAAD